MFFPLQQHRQERQRSKFAFTTLACFLLLLLLEVLHIAGQTSSEQCWKVLNKMHDFHESYELLKKCWSHACNIAN